MSTKRVREFSPTASPPKEKRPAARSSSLPPAANATPVTASSVPTTGTAASTSAETTRVHSPTSPSQGSRLFFLDDPEGVWEGKLVGLTLAIREHLPDCQLEMLTPVAGGYRIRPRKADGFENAFSKAKSAFGNVSLGRVSPPSRPVEVILRGVDAGFTCPEILEDLRSSFGQEIRAVRRLHAFTEGKVDSTRPLPIVVVTVEETSASQLKGGVRLFGVLNVRSGAPRAKAQVTQCSRCFAWGHRAAACTSRRRCIRCGSFDHVSKTCTRPASERWCFACKGDHAVTYAGCPSSTAARRLMTSALTPATTRRPALPVSRDTDGRSFADVARSSTSAQPPTSGWKLVTGRRTSAKTTDVHPRPPTTEEMETDSVMPSGDVLSAPGTATGSAEDPVPAAPRAPTDRAAKSRELAIRTREIKSRLREIEDERRRIADARDSGFTSKALSRRLKTINGHHKRLSQSLKDLEKQRANLSPKARAASPHRPSPPPPQPPAVADESPLDAGHVSRSRSRARSQSSPSPARAPSRLQSSDLTKMVLCVLRDLRTLIRTSSDAAAAIKAVDSLIATLLACVERCESACSS